MLTQVIILSTQSGMSQNDFQVKILTASQNSPHTNHFKLCPGLIMYAPIVFLDKRNNKCEIFFNEDGEKIALWNSSNYLELAIYKSNPRTVGGASTLFGLDYWDTVTVSFS